MAGPIDQTRGDDVPDVREAAHASSVATPVEPVAVPDATQAESNGAPAAAPSGYGAVVQHGRVALRIMGQTLVLLVAEVVASALIDGIGIQTGNAGYKSVGVLTERGPLALFAVGVLLLPFFEELVFRLVPSKLCDWLGVTRHAEMWGPGVAAAILFAAMHNLTSQSGGRALQLDADTWFSLEFLPISQFLAGLYLWHVMRKHGFLASFGAHAFHNFVLLSLALAASAVAD